VQRLSHFSDPCPCRWEIPVHVLPRERDDRATHRSPFAES
jgi:hypothetical protein